MPLHSTIDPTSSEFARNADVMRGLVSELRDKLKEVAGGMAGMPGMGASKAPAPHVAGQGCANCNFYQGAATGFGPCQLFPGKAVNAKGWCSGYAKKA